MQEPGPESTTESSVTPGVTRRPSALWTDAAGRHPGSVIPDPCRPLREEETEVQGQGQARRLSPPHSSLPAPVGRVRTAHPPPVWTMVRAERHPARASQEGWDKPGLASAAAWGWGRAGLVQLGKPSGSDQ